MDYTKYVLKDNEELTALLADKDNIFVIACNKCFKEFESVNEDDGDEFVKLASEQGKNITGIIKVDFLCNQLLSKKKLEGVIPEGTDFIAVVSCGLGIQIIAEMEDLPVIAASDSLNYIGQHGMDFRHAYLEELLRATDRGRSDEFPTFFGMERRQRRRLD